MAPSIHVQLPRAPKAKRASFDNLNTRYGLLFDDVCAGLTSSSHSTSPSDSSRLSALEQPRAFTPLLPLFFSTEGLGSATGPEPLAASPNMCAAAEEGVVRQPDAIDILSSL